jgi:gluconolactonase
MNRQSADEQDKQDDGCGTQALTGAGPGNGMLVRRQFLQKTLGVTALSVAGRMAFAQTRDQDRDWSGQSPLRYPDPAVEALDPRFRRLVPFNTPIQRLYTGTLWAEGPAWNGVGRYVVWSDIPNNVQMRWIEDDGRVTRFRQPSGNSNGNTFDFQGRQLSAEHGGRRVVRYEPSGAVTVIAESFDGKKLNSPNDLVVHPDGSIWFTDPTFGINGYYEGSPAESEIAPAVYRVDGTSGRIEQVITDVRQPNGLCFSPDYSLLYVADQGQAMVWDVDGSRVRNGRSFAQVSLPDGTRSSPDGMRCDNQGNLWWGGNPGVMVVAPDGVPIGMIRMPEVTPNICFGGVKRNRLFMASSQSLYSVYLNVAGAHIC